MANQNYSNIRTRSVNKSTGAYGGAPRGALSSPMPTKAGPFPGLPGKKQSGDRSYGIKKLKTHTRDEGL